ncbi:SusD/RagB family nutrient-binding outer membrane lipoprotein [Hymenobacter coalescens]
MRINKVPVTLSMLALLAGGTGCDKFLDVNKDPINPADADINLVLPASQAAMATNLGHSTLGLSQPTSAIVQQLNNFRVGTFDLNGSSFNNQWLGLYSGALVNNEQVLNKATALRAWRYVGIAQIQKAYMFSEMVDVWGDIPYSEAFKGQGIENIAPKFDDDAAIYADLFRLIDEGIANLNRTDDTQRPGVDDLIYNGSTAKWIRLGNTLKLKLYNQVRLVQNVQTSVAPLLAANANLITAADDFEFRYGRSTNPQNQHPGYSADYANSGRENNIGVYFFNLMKGSTTANRPTDPRIPYYFYNQKATTAAELNADYQDGRFVTVRFGSVGPQASANNTSIRTLQGLYPIGGRFDNGAGGVANVNSGTGDVPQRFLTFFARKFIEAELHLTVLNNPADAKTAFQAALNASFDKVAAIANSAGVVLTTAQQTQLTADRTAYITAALARYDAATSTEGKLEVIMTEKYISSFGYGIDIYTDYRRTGYPRITLADTDGDAQTTQTGPFPVRLPYRLNDLLTNPNAPAQPNINTERVFWDPS